MPEWLKNRAVVTTAAAMALFGAGMVAFPPAVLVEVLSTLTLIACGLGLWRWGPTGWRVFWKGANRTEDWGILAVDFMLISIAALRIYAIIFRQLDRPVWLQDSYWSSFFVYLMLCAVTLFVAATRDETPR